MDNPDNKRKEVKSRRPKDPYEKRKDFLEQYTSVLSGASGITKEQAKTCLYYAMLTYGIPSKKVNIMPILNLEGPPGTGKTNLLRQLRMELRHA